MLFVYFFALAFAMTPADCFVALFLLWTTCSLSRRMIEHRERAIKRALVLKRRSRHLRHIIWKRRLRRYDCRAVYFLSSKVQRCLANYLEYWCFVTHEVGVYL